MSEATNSPLSTAFDVWDFVKWLIIVGMLTALILFFSQWPTQTFSVVNGTPADLLPMFGDQVWWYRVDGDRLVEILPPSPTALTVVAEINERVFPKRYWVDVYVRCHLTVEDFESLRENIKPEESDDSGRWIWITWEFFKILRGLEGKNIHGPPFFDEFEQDFDTRYPADSQTRYEALRSGDWVLIYDHEEQTLYLHNHRYV